MNALTLGLVAGFGLLSLTAQPAAAQYRVGGGVTVDQSVLDSLGAPPNVPQLLSPLTVPRDRGTAGVTLRPPGSRKLKQVAAAKPESRFFAGAATGPLPYAAPTSGLIANPPQLFPRSGLTTSADQMAAAPGAAPTPFASNATAANPFGTTVAQPPMPSDPIPAAQVPAQAPTQPPVVAYANQPSSSGQQILGRMSANDPFLGQPAVQAIPVQPSVIQPVQPVPVQPQAVPVQQAQAIPQTAPPRNPAAVPVDSAPLPVRQAGPGSAPPPPPLSSPPQSPPQSAFTPPPPPGQVNSQVASLPASGGLAPRATAPAPVNAVGGSAAGGLTQLPFAAGSAELSDSARQELTRLAGRLNREGESRIQLLAYATGTPETESQARRLSLSRALAVRAFLIEQGVRSTRMDVRALGTRSPDGPTDRVDAVPAS